MGASMELDSIMEPLEIQFNYVQGSGPSSNFEQIRNIHEVFVDTRGSTCMNRGSESDLNSVLTQSTMYNESNAFSEANMSHEGTLKRAMAEPEKVLKRRVLERKLRKKKGAKLKKIRSFSCTDLPLMIHKEYQLWSRNSKKCQINWLEIDCKSSKLR